MSHPRKPFKSHPSPHFSIPDLPPSDPLYDLMTSIATDFLPGDLPLSSSSDQLIYYDPRTRLFTLPATPFPKHHFSHLFGSSQNRPTSIQTSIERISKCELRGDFRVRTVELVGKSKEDVIFGWGKVMDECCRMPSLRPKNYIVVDKRTNSLMTTEKPIEAKEAKQQAMWGHVITNLSEVFVVYLGKTGVINRLQRGMPGTTTVVLDTKKRQITVSSNSQSDLQAAKQTCDEEIAAICEMEQCVYLSVPIPAESLPVISVKFAAGLDMTELYAYIPLGEVVCTADLPSVLVSLMPQISAITGGVPISVDLREYQYDGKLKKVEFVRFALSQEETACQIARLQKAVFDGVSREGGVGRAGGRKPAVYVGCCGKRKLILEAGKVALGKGWESGNMCVGKLGEVPGIELALT